MATLIKDIMKDLDSKNPYIIVEERGVGFQPTLIPGHLFSLNVNLPFAVNENMLPLNKFQYNEEKDDRHFLTKVPYYDQMPIGISLRTEAEGMISMLNLKVIPPVMRYKILETYYQTLSKFIHVGYEEDLSKEKLTILERLKENNYIAPFLGVTKKFMEDITGINLSFAINKYNIDTLQNVKLLDWNSLPELTKMNVSDRGMVFNSGIGGLQGVFESFESKI